MYKIAVVDWATSPRGDEECIVERTVIKNITDFGPDSPKASVKYGCFWHISLRSSE